MLRYAARLALSALGWRLPTSVSKEDKAVIVFSHSSYWDFYLFLVYMMAVPELLEDTWIVMKPQPFGMFGGYAGEILYRLGFIPATKVEERNKGFVEKTIKFLESKERYSLMLSPKGTIISAPWRSGYYWIACRLEVPIQILGLDYRDRCFYLSSPISSKMPIEELQPILQQEMAKITPLYLHQELHPDDAKEDNIAIVSKENLGCLVKVILTGIVGLCFFL